MGIIIDDFQSKLEQLRFEIEKGNTRVVKEYKALIDECIDYGEPQGYIELGYAHYLGYVGFEQDYHKALEAFLEALKLTDDPYVANTLGYIYYYGRTNNGVADYKAAFYYFSIGAKSGVTESVYKIADMYYHGYGVKKNIEHAIYAYEKSYYLTLSFFINDARSKFADLCLRQARISFDERHDKVKALGYYLEAEYSLRLRVEDDYVGDAGIYAKTKRKIAELNEALGLTIPKKLPNYAPIDFNRDIKGIKEIPYILECALVKESDKKAKLIIADQDRQAFLVTIPSLNYAKLHDQLILTFTAEIEQDILFSFTDLDIADSTITIRDYVTPEIKIQYKELKILL